MSTISKNTYDLNKWISETLADIPIVGDDLVHLQKLSCDYIINPLVIGGDHAGCVAVDDVYHGLKDQPKSTDPGSERANR